MYEIKAFHCSFCKKYSSAKAVITKHEKKCFYNAATRSCVTCLFFDKKDTKQLADVPFCHMGYSFEQSGNSLFYRVKLRTDCKHWQEKPEDEEEYIILLGEMLLNTSPIIPEEPESIDDKIVKFPFPF